MQLKKDTKESAPYTGNLSSNVFSRITDGIIVLDTEWHFVYVNQKAAEILNRKYAKDLIGKHFWTEYPEKVSQPLYNAYHKAMDRQELVFLEDFYKPWNQWFENRIYPSQEGLTIYLIEITDRKNNELTLLEKVEHFRNMFMNHFSMMLLIEPESGSIIDANLSAEKFYGYPISHLRTMNINEIDILPSNIIKEKIKQVVQKTKQQFIFSHRLANGEVRIVEVHSSTIVSRGKPLLFSIVNGITEKKKTLEELILAKEIAEEANRVKVVFLANMNHELRTPLIGILGYSQLILEESTEPDTIEMATGIRKGGIRLLNTLNLILDLTRIESCRFELDLRIVNQLEEIKNIYETFQEAASEKKIEYSLQILNDQLFTNTDQRIFNTILENLINNAIKFTNEGSITIICGIETDDMIYVTVKDTGIGIAKEHHELIFEEFHQVSEGINREYQGTGLGLAITKKYVEILGGKISIESQLGVGSSFTIRFPSAR